MLNQIPLGSLRYKLTDDPGVTRAGYADQNNEHPLSRKRSEGSKGILKSGCYSTSKIFEHVPVIGVSK